jgi:hypothetical protein
MVSPVRSSVFPQILDVRDGARPARRCIVPLIHRGSYRYIGRIPQEQGCIYRLVMTQSSLYCHIRLLDTMEISLVSQRGRNDNSPLWLDMPSTKVICCDFQESLLLIFNTASPELSDVRLGLHVAEDIPEDQVWMREEIGNSLKQRPRLKNERWQRDFTQIHARAYCLSILLTSQYGRLLVSRLTLGDD